MLSSCGAGSEWALKMLGDIEEECPVSWRPAICSPPETPTESMEFLARSWSLSATELSKALSHTHTPPNCHEMSPLRSVGGETHLLSSRVSRESQHQQPPTEENPPISPGGGDNTKELFLLHQVLNPDFLSGQQLLRNGICRSIMRGKTMSRWLKDQKERKHEARPHNARLQAAVSVAGVAAAVAGLAASLATSPERSSTQKKPLSRTSAAVASAAALVASHCIEIAEDMGADHEHILSVVSSAIHATTDSDFMTLTAGAATALRGAATLKTKLRKGYGAASVALAKQVEDSKESSVMAALNFVSKGGELLKCTRKDAISGVYCDTPAWAGREGESNVKKAYFGIKTADRIIEFECSSKGEKEMWTVGIQYMLKCQANMT